MNKILTLLLSCYALGVMAQESIGPMLRVISDNNNEKSSSGTFDSTFVFTTDTISLPVFDDFSSDKFQKYTGDFSAVGISSDLIYHLHDMSDVPLPSNVEYTIQSTFRRTFDTEDGSSTIDYFPAIQVKVGDLSSYPVVHAQQDVYPAFYIYDTIGSGANESDTVWIVDPDVRQDSARIFFQHITDQSKIWQDEHVYRNFGYARDPFSLGVATFDGLDEFGHPYALGTATSGYADYLTSKVIDMTSATVGDSVYFSFVYQPEGYGDVPEETDSLIVEFFNQSTGQWDWVWSTKGSPSHEFKHVHIKVDNIAYFTDGFQFRFKNYGALSGNLDNFHLDYVNLRQFSGMPDTIIRDFAFVYPIHTLLKDYTAVPWDHYKADPTNKMSDSVKIVVRNNDNIPENEQDGSVEVFYQGASEFSTVLSEALLNNNDLNYLPMTSYISFHDFSAGNSYDDTKPGIQEQFDYVGSATHQNSSFLQNDTTYGVQRFQNFYSYDDGSAEAAYGPTGVQSRLAIQYETYVADSVIGIRMNFVPSVNDVTNNLFLVTVWNDNNGEPGSVIYEDDVFLPRTPHFGYGRDNFVDYYFQDTMKVHVEDKFYVGWRQFEQDRLNIGMDMNINNSDKVFYSIDNEISWANTSFEGSVMIHPIFSTGMDAILGLESNKKDISATVFPNPTNGKVNIRMDQGVYQGAEVYNMQGTQILNTEEQIIDLSNEPKGVYFIRLVGSSQMYKVIRI